MLTIDRFVAGFMFGLAVGPWMDFGWPQTVLALLLGIAILRPTIGDDDG